MLRYPHGDGLNTAVPNEPSNSLEFGPKVVPVFLQGTSLPEQP